MNYLQKISRNKDMSHSPSYALLTISKWRLVVGSGVCAVNPWGKVTGNDCVTGRRPTMTGVAVGFEPSEPSGTSSGPAGFRGRGAPR